MMPSKVALSTTRSKDPRRRGRARRSPRTSASGHDSGAERELRVGKISCSSAAMASRRHWQRSSAEREKSTPSTLQYPARWSPAQKFASSPMHAQAARNQACARVATQTDTQTPTGRDDRILTHAADQNLLPRVALRRAELRLILPPREHGCNVVPTRIPLKPRVNARMGFVELVPERCEVHARSACARGVQKRSKAAGTATQCQGQHRGRGGRQVRKTLESVNAELHAARAAAFSAFAIPFVHLSQRSRRDFGDDVMTRLFCSAPLAI